MTKIIRSYRDLSQEIIKKEGVYKLRRMSKEERLEYAKSHGWVYKPEIPPGSFKQITEVTVTEPTKETYTGYQPVSEAGEKRIYDEQGKIIGYESEKYKATAYREPYETAETIEQQTPKRIIRSIAEEKQKLTFAEQSRGYAPYKKSFQETIEPETTKLYEPIPTGLLTESKPQGWASRASIYAEKQFYDYQYKEKKLKTYLKATGAGVGAGVLGVGKSIKENPEETILIATAGALWPPAPLAIYGGSKYIESYAKEPEITQLGVTKEIGAFGAFAAGSYVIGKGIGNIRENRLAPEFKASDIKTERLITERNIFDISRIKAEVTTRGKTYEIKGLATETWLKQEKALLSKIRGNYRIEQVIRKQKLKLKVKETYMAESTGLSQTELTGGKSIKQTDTETILRHELKESKIIKQFLTREVAETTGKEYKHFAYMKGKEYSFLYKPKKPFKLTSMGKFYSRRDLAVDYFLGTKEYWRSIGKYREADIPKGAEIYPEIKGLEIPKKTSTMELMFKSKKGEYGKTRLQELTRSELLRTSETTYKNSIIESIKSIERTKIKPKYMVTPITATALKSDLKIINKPVLEVQQENIQRNIQRNLQRNIPRNIQRNIQRSLQRNIQRNIQRSLQRNIQRNLQRNIQKSITIKPMAGLLFTPPITPPLTTPISPLPPLKPSFISAIFSRKKRRLFTQYTPSLRAIDLGIKAPKGFKPEKFIGTGFKIRPLV